MGKEAVSHQPSAISFQLLNERREHSLDLDHLACTLVV